jgi:FkbM family methyltransferase
VIDPRYPGLDLRARPPLLLRLGQRTSRWYRIKALMERHGGLAGAALFPFHATTLAAPLAEGEVWRYGTLANYNRATTENFAAIADERLGEFDYVDCGAHLGLFGAQFATFSHNCRRITAIEPNPEVFPFLAGNLRAGRCTDVVTLNAAIGDFTGQGRLCAPDYDPDSNHALYLEADPQGPIKVIRLDSLTDRIGPCLALKLDIEDQELAVLQSAADLLRSRDRLVLCVELHRKVLARVGQTDTGLLAAINAIRKLTWVDADHRDRVIDPARSVWAQIGNAHQGDLIGFTA